MNKGRRLVAGEIGRIKYVQEPSGQTCQICAHEVELTVDGEPFCRTCYEYERREGNLEEDETHDLDHELEPFNDDEIGRIIQELSGQTCLVCGNAVKITVDGKLFAACNECGFPVCRTCYEYQRREGNQACPRCQYKHIIGSPRVEGDEEEDETDDLEHEFDYGPHNRNEFELLNDVEIGNADEKCGFWKLADPPMCCRYSQISGLLQKITTLKREVQMLELEKDKRKHCRNAFWVVSFLVYVVAVVFVML